MPRCKVSHNLRGFDVWRLGNFKSYSSDMLLDFEVIYRMQRERFSEFLPADFEKNINNTLKLLRKSASGLKPLNHSRLYLITGFDTVRLVAYNLEDCLIDNLELLEMVDIRENNDDFGLNPDYVTTLFVFQESDLVFSYDLRIATAMELIIAFRQENLINAGAFRDTWYGAPRRRARRDDLLT